MQFTKDQTEAIRDMVSKSAQFKDPQGKWIDMKPGSVITQATEVRTKPEPLEFWIVGTTIYPDKKAATDFAAQTGADVVFARQVTPPVVVLPPKS